MTSKWGSFGCWGISGRGAVRLSVGWMSTPEEIEVAATALSEGVAGLPVGGFKQQA